jgi:hypothetical protein
MASAGVQVEKVVLVGERIWLDPNGAQVLPLPDVVIVSLCLLTRRDLPTGPVSTFSSQRRDVASRLPVQRVEVAPARRSRARPDPAPLPTLASGVSDARLAIRPHPRFSLRGCLRLLWHPSRSSTSFQGFMPIILSLLVRRDWH